MRDTSLLELAGNGHQVRYRVEVLMDAQVLELGIEYGEPSQRRMLEWSAVLCGLAAEVGEPEGVRAIVFDLVVERFSRPEGEQYTIRRLTAEPGEEAMAVARAIELALAPSASAPSIKNLASEGTPSRWYQDLEEFEAAALQSLTQA
jgi:hypothetical protein